MQTLTSMYSITSQLGRGSDAVVYEAKKDGRIYALKMISVAEMTTYDMYTSMFPLEARIMIDLINVDGVPKIQQVFRQIGDLNTSKILRKDMSIVKNSFVIAMTKPVRYSLMLGSFPIREKSKLRSIFTKLSRIVRDVNNNGICHMDIHNGNVMVSTNYEEVTLIDFGRAQYKSMPYLPNVLGALMAWPVSPPEVRSEGRLVYDAFTVWTFGKMMYETYRPDKTSDEVVFPEVENDITLPSLLKDLLARVFKKIEDRITLEEMLNHDYFNEEVKQDYKVCGASIIYQQQAIKK
jgi:serine/threonine protein kinase